MQSSNGENLTFLIEDIGGLTTSLVGGSGESEEGGSEGGRIRNNFCVLPIMLSKWPLKPALLLELSHREK